MERIRDQFEETISLGMLEGNRIIYLVIVESHRSMRLAPRRGDRDPLHATALGKAIAAHLPERRVRAILEAEGMARLTPHTLITLDAYHAELAATRERGYALDDGEHEIDGRCVAVPLLGRNLPAAISYSAPASRFPLERVAGVAEALAGARFEARQGRVDRLVEPLGLRPPGAHVLHARLGGDREAGGDEVGAEDARHFGDARALAAQQRAHLARALVEVIDPLGGHRELSSVSLMITSSVRGPWTPSTRSSSMSEVALGPDTNVSGRAGSRAKIASTTDGTIERASTMQTWRSGTSVSARRPQPSPAASTIVPVSAIPSVAPVTTASSAPKRRRSRVSCGTATPRILASAVNRS
jgi:hypothetical protein